MPVQQVAGQLFARIACIKPHLFGLPFGRAVHLIKIVALGLHPVIDCFVGFHPVGRIPHPAVLRQVGADQGGGRMFLP